MKLKGIDEKTVVHCSTIELARTCCVFAWAYKKQWKDGDNYLAKTNWEICKEYTCYSFLEGTFGTLQSYIELGYKILSAEEFIALNSEVTDSPTISPENAKAQDLNETLEVLRVLSTVLTQMDSDETMKKVSDLKMKYLGKL